MINIDFIYNEIFRNIREELGYTQQEFAELLHCTQAQVSRIESNERPVSNEILTDLSNLYKVDLRNNLNVITNFKSFEVFEKYQKLLKFQNLNNHDLLHELEEELKDPILEQEFNTGELLLLKNLSHAIVQCFLHKNFSLAMEYCLKNTECTEEEMLTYNPQTIKSPFFYSSMTCFCISAFSLGKIDLTLAVCGNMFDHYNEVWSNEVYSYATNDIFYKMQNIFFYIIYAFILFKSEAYIQAYQMCDVITFKAKELNILNMIGFMLFIKFQVLYKLGDIDLAKEVFGELQVIYKYAEIPEALYSFTEFTPEDYPLLFA